MFDNINTNDEERGQVGIGTLIVFIALVLVAAIAAGVLINTAGFLQNQAESTGEESTQQVTNSLSVQSTLGTANGSSGIDEIELTVDKSPGSGPIDMTSTTIQYVSPYGAATLTEIDTATAGNSEFEVSSDTLEDGNGPVTVTILLGATNGGTMGSLEPGDEVEMQLVTPSGGQSTVVATVPQPLTTDSDGDQVRL